MKEPLVMKAKKDAWGMWLSGLCIVHCVLAPLLALALGTGLLVSWFNSEWVHALLYGPIALLIVMSIVPTFVRYGYWPGLICAGFGLLSLSVSLVFHGWPEQVLAIAGGTGVFTAHFLNARFMRCHQHTAEDLNA